MKIAPLAKISAARKRLIEKEMKMPKIDVEALWQLAERTRPNSGSTYYQFARLILEEAAKACEEYPKRDPSEDGNGYWAAENCAAAIREMKP